MKNPKIEIEKVREDLFIIRCKEPECVNSNSSWNDAPSRKDAEEAKLWHESWHKKKEQN